MYCQLTLEVQLAGATRRIIGLEPLGDCDGWEEGESVQMGNVDNRLEREQGCESVETYI
jgi:hypothetical protein